MKIHKQVTNVLQEYVTPFKHVQIAAVFSHSVQYFTEWEVWKRILH